MFVFLRLKCLRLMKLNFTKFTRKTQYRILFAYFSLSLSLWPKNIRIFYSFSFYQKSVLLKNSSLIIMLTINYLSPNYYHCKNWMRYMHWYALFAALISAYQFIATPDTIYRLWGLTPKIFLMRRKGNPKKHTRY